MDTLIAQLDKKYGRYKKGLADGEFKNDVYFVSDCAFDYFYITENQPEIKKILEQGKKELEEKKKEIIKLNESPEIQKELIENAEHESLYFCYNEIYRDMYLPISKHKNVLKLLSAKEVIGETKIIKENFLKVLALIGRALAKILGIQIKKDAPARVAITTIAYNFNEKKYRVYMEKVHTLLIQQLLKLCVQKTPAVIENSKIKIIFDDKKGIYQEDNPDLVYKLEKGKGRYKIIHHLISKDNVSLAELISITTQRADVVMTSIRKINESFRDLDIPYDLIVNFGTSGYSLNKEIFSIEVKR